MPGFIILTPIKPNCIRVENLYGSGWAQVRHVQVSLMLVSAFQLTSLINNLRWTWVEPKDTGPDLLKSHPLLCRSRPLTFILEDLTFQCPLNTQSSILLLKVLTLIHFFFYFFALDPMISKPMMSWDPGSFSIFNTWILRYHG